MQEDEDTEPDKNQKGTYKLNRNSFCGKMIEDIGRDRKISLHCHQRQWVETAGVLKMQI